MIRPTVAGVARQIAALAQEGHELLIVHGGGKIFTSTLQRMGIESQIRGWSACDGSRIARCRRDGSWRLAE